MVDVRLQGVTKRFGEVTAIRGADLTIKSGEFAVFVGPSGCGKSTFLRLIAGLESVSDGTISIGGENVTETPARHRGVAMVFQNYALYPHMTARQNIAFGLRNLGTPREEIEARVEEAARILQIQPLLERRPSDMSGGQRQRVAIGRAIVKKPKLFLFDEPLSNLDAGLRVEMRAEIARLHQELDATMIFVTHDQTEAMTLADRIVVMKAGVIEQAGRPLDLYNAPTNLTVAGFLGSPKMNFLKGHAGNGSIAIEGSALPIQTAIPVPGGAVTIGIRPEHVALVDTGGDLGGRVHMVERLGNLTYAHITLDDGTPVIAASGPDATVAMGDMVSLRIDERRVHMFDAAGNVIGGAAQ